MDNLVQIVCGCAGEDTILECTRVPRMLGAKVIVVHGIWPRIQYFTSTEPHSYAEKWVSPEHQIDNIKQLCKNHKFTFIQMKKFAYNGEMYNIALEYIKEHKIPCDHIWFQDVDECIDPDDIERLKKDLKLVKTMEKNQLRFSTRIEILPGWRAVADSMWPINAGIVFGNLLFAQRKEDFDGNYHFKETKICKPGITKIPVYHLHNLRKHGANRIKNGIFYSGGLKAEIDKARPLEDTSFIRSLKEKYTKFYEDREGVDTYVGSSIFDSCDNHKQPDR